MWYGTTMGSSSTGRKTTTSCVKRKMKHECFYEGVFSPLFMRVLENPPKICDFSDREFGMNRAIFGLGFDGVKYALADKQ